ncbi:MAG: hypothetical protein PHH54_04315 [Candidatus Nanoarchaeia archaeon]|nr:hypothetical protein [Candidatus Nanoarchaeia archaeon]MDD5741185.1 hypothetical protein [Candidatus Nanoarchaeia archaeon]
MDYNNAHGLWKKEGKDSAVEAKIQKGFERIGKDYYSIINNNSLISVKIYYDDLLKRTLVRTEVNPKGPAPKELIRLLEDNEFTKIL